MTASPIPKPVSDELQTRIASQAEAARRLSNKVVYGGRLRDALARERIDVENPAAEEIIGTIAACGREDVEAAVSSAQEGFLTWSRLPVRERGRFMLRAADHLEGHIEEIAQLAAFET